jgi:WD40 repeat protein
VWHVDKRQPAAQVPTDGPVSALAFLPDGTPAVGLRNKTVILWDVAAKKAKKTVEGPAAPSRLAPSPDGKKLYLGCRESRMLAWDLAGPAEELPIWREEGDTSALAVARDGALVFSADDSGFAWIWKPGQEEAVRKLKHGDRVRTPALAPDGKAFATGGENVVKLWDAATGEERPGFEAPQMDVASLAFSADGKILFAGTSERQLKHLDAATGSVKATHPAGEAPLVELAVSPDGKRLAGASRETTARIWTLK